MSENEDENPVINPNLTQDDVLSLSAVYGLTLNKKQRSQLKGVQPNNELRWDAGRLSELKRL